MSIRTEMYARRNSRGIYTPRYFQRRRIFRNDVGTYEFIMSIVERDKNNFLKTIDNDRSSREFKWNYVMFGQTIDWYEL